MEIYDDECFVCVDCLAFIASGDLPEDEDDHERILSGAGDMHWVCGDSERDEEFSWRSCDCCGSSLGGSRHHAVILCEAES
jgi:hypothetical protein